MKTYVPKQGDVTQKWYVVDAEGQSLGRLATDVARVLRGKHKPSYTPNDDVGDFVVVVNAEKLRLAPKKLQDKMYYRHSGYPGGLKALNLQRLLDTHPTRVFERAVRGMLPHNRLGDAMYRKLHVYAGPDHPHGPQQPRALGELLKGQPTGGQYSNGNEA